MDEGKRIAEAIRELIVHVHKTGGGEFGGHEYYGPREGTKLEMELAEAIQEALDGRGDATQNQSGGS